MILALSVSLLCAVALAGTSADVGLRAASRAGATILIAGSLTAALAADAALAVLVGARLLDAAPAAAVLGWGPERPGPIPIPVPISLTAAMALGFVVVAALSDWRRARLAARQVQDVQNEARDRELVVVRSERFVAQAVPGRRAGHGRIVVSDSLLRSLEPGERAALLAHERSHLRHHHDRYRRLIRIAGRINPLLRPAVDATDLLLERWADEDAARAIGSRRVAARALLRAGVANEPARFGHPSASFAAELVSARVGRLLAAEPGRGAGPALILSGALALIAALAAVAGLHSLAHLFDMRRGDG